MLEGKIPHVSFLGILGSNWEAISSYNKRLMTRTFSALFFQNISSNFGLSQQFQHLLCNSTFVTNFALPQNNQQIWTGKHFQQLWTTINIQQLWSVKTRPNMSNSVSMLDNFGVPQHFQQLLSDTTFSLTLDCHKISSNFGASSIFNNF